MMVEQPDLRDGRRADKPGALIELRTRLHAAAAGNAARQWVCLFLLRGIHARTGAEIVGSIHRDPGLHALQVLKEHAAVDREIAHKGKLAQWLNADGLLQFV